MTVFIIAGHTDAVFIIRLKVTKTDLCNRNGFRLCFRFWGRSLCSVFFMRAGAEQKRSQKYQSRKKRRL